VRYAISQSRVCIGLLYSDGVRLSSYVTEARGKKGKPVISLISIQRAEKWLAWFMNNPLKPSEISFPE
jgi:hypothetical protein